MLIFARLPRLLHIANASPPHWSSTDKQAFYALKQRLLERYAAEGGFDVQHIPGKRCWRCDGTGTHTYFESGDQDYCWKCGGDGWFKSPKWVTLQRYVWGPYPFHIPRETSYKRPVPDITRIEGYIAHAVYGGRQSELAYAWLCVKCCKWRLFWSWVKSGRPCGLQWHPLLVLKQVVNTIRWNVPSPVKCRECEGRMWVTTWNRYGRTCSSCQSRKREDVPF